MKKIYAVILLFLGIFMLSSCEHRSRKAVENEAAILDAIQSHGSNYTIIKEVFDSYGDSGRNPDINEFQYTVEDGEWIVHLK